MEPIQTPITGSEECRGLLSPIDALAHFYHAFNTRSIDAMAQSWAQLDDIAMDNPLGGIKRGWSEIGPLYEKLFSGPAKVYVEYYDYTIHEGDDLFYAVGRERGSFKLGDIEMQLAIRTTRIFKKIAGLWKQVHHHGSIDDPNMLARYQSAVIGKAQSISQT